MVDLCHTEDFPHGNVKLAWQRLKKYFEQSANSKSKMDDHLDKRSESMDLEGLTTAMKNIDIKDKTKMSISNPTFHVTASHLDGYEAAVNSPNDVTTTDRSGDNILPMVKVQDNIATRQAENKRRETNNQS